MTVAGTLTVTLDPILCLHSGWTHATHICMGMRSGISLVPLVSMLQPHLPQTSVFSHNMDPWSYTVEPLYNEVLGTMKITLSYQVSRYIRVKKNIYKELGPANDLVIRGFRYIWPAPFLLYLLPEGHFHGKGCTLEINETHPKYLGWLPLFQFISCTYTILCWRNLHAKFHPQIPCNFYFMAHYVCKFDLFGVSFKFWQFPSKWQNRKSFTYIHSTLQESCVMSHKCAWQISARLVK